MMGDRWTPEEIAQRKREMEGTGEGRRELEALLGVVDGDRPAFTDDEDERR